MFILNIETSNKNCSVCVCDLSGEILIERAQLAESHAAILMPMIDACLHEIKINYDDLCAVAVSNGPGAYTALRVGVSTAKGLCYSLDIPLIAVDSLKMCAEKLFNDIQNENAIYCPMFDARRMEVYTAFYTFKNKKIETIEPPHALIITENVFDKFLDDGKEIILSGFGAEKLIPLFENKKNIKFYDEKKYPTAGMMCASSAKDFQEKNFEDLENYAPLYLKPPNITISKKIIF